MAGTASRAAFEIVKGEREVRTLSEAQVEQCLDLRELLDGLRDGFRALELGEVRSPSRPEVVVPGKGFSLAMPAWRPGAQLCVKIVNVFDGNLGLGLPGHLAMINLFDPDTGAATCVMDGTYITGIRTAASAVLSVRLLARRDARVVTIVGAGVQAREHLRLLPLVRDFERVNVCSLYPEEAERLAARTSFAHATDDLAAAVRESDVVCLATHSARPVLDPDWVRPGTHVSSVGYFPPDGELPRELAERHRLFVECADAFRPAPVGCAELSGADPATAATLGAVALDPAAGRRDDAEITVYKAMGIGMEDMVAADLAYRRALRDGVGGVMLW
ncbi:ornithine cyclodeaminase family protein [Spongiactinospora sp. TRM90649]|uniref:ornithine cyclodeaminase family protein n=1 Tax=Spongiactinospora sp. TRM90649 TaxID=3031114 RepID=UPI0023F68F47|nr:ornithine cyclodeaminase family protein [Spongiactinospora sp. TRM90649]MDF5757775.1 ornithine cyclodeaminase family protein [Spongiactinospora sp. TRM90649]